MSMNDGVSRSRRLSATLGNLNTSDRPFQTMVLKRGQGELWRADFSGKPNVFRIYPGYNPDNLNEFDPWRLSLRDSDYGQWFYPVVTANVSCQASGQGRSWVMSHPLDNSYDMTRNPLVLMRTAVKSALNQKLPFSVNWLSLIQAGKGRGEELAGPKECWLVQVALMEHKGNVYNPPRGGGADDETVFMLLTTSAVQAVKTAMEQRNHDFRGDHDDIAGHFVNGDPIALSDGAFVVLFPRGKDPRQADHRTGGFGNSRENSSGGGKEIIGYDAYLTKEWNGIGANLSAYEDIVRSHVKHWDDAINFPTNEEQVKMLEQVFRPYSDLLVYALDDTYGRLLDPNIRQEGLVRLGRSRPVEVVQLVAQPVAAVTQTVPKGFGAPVAPAPRAGGFGAPNTRSSESIDPPTNTHGISESPDVPVVRNATQGTNEATTNALELLARARRDAMRGGSVPKPANSN